MMIMPAGVASNLQLHVHYNAMLVKLTVLHS